MTDVEKKIGYEFNKLHYLERALTHSSYANEKKTQSNERLEFLGDSVLSLIVSNYLFHKLSRKDEGDLTKIRSTLVCESALAEVAKKIDLGKLILLGRGEEMTGGRERASVVSDAFEALLAAIYLDGGFEAAENWLMSLMSEELEVGCTGKYYKDYKTILQEEMQKRSGSRVSYRMTGEKGLEHSKTFAVDVLVDGDIFGSGTGTSKKEAEQAAAEAALSAMGLI